MTSKIYGDICDGCYAKNFCDMALFGGHNPRITACPKFKKGKQTNADKIRAMTDEEIAKLFAYGLDCPTDVQFLSNCPFHDDATVCQNCWLDWLQKEADE